MARMAKLTYDSPHRQIPQNKGPVKGDIRTYENVTLIALHKAKKAKPGKVQFLKLKLLKSGLCPIKALKIRISSISRGSDSLFCFNTAHGKVNLTKRRVNTVLSATWKFLRRPEISGHLFRVGGASLQNALDILITQIMSLGQWKTNFYKQ